VMGDLTDDRIKAIRTKRPDALYSGIGWADRMVDDMRALAAEVARHRAAQSASAERVREVVRREVLDRTACVAGWDGFLPGSIKRMADDIANRVAAQLSAFEDGGEPRKRQPHGPHVTQQGAATPGQGATAQGAAQAAGNVAEPQLGPTPDRVERPPSSPSLGEEYACDCAKNRCPVAADLQRGPCTGTCGCRGCARGYSDFLGFE